MEINYCRQWSRHHKRFHEPLTEAEAREAHSNGKLYTAVLGNRERPYCFLELSAYRSVSVNFLDAFQRIYLDYSFQEMNGRPNELFLSLACIREFFELSDDPIRAPVCFFKTDGQLVIDHTEFNPATRVERIVEREELRTDVSDHWEPYPEFGQYEGLSRIRSIAHLTL